MNYMCVYSPRNRDELCEYQKATEKLLVEER